MTAAVDLRDVSLCFGSGAKGSVLALDRISLTVQEGEFVSLVGPSGCGKTTILNLIAGLVTVPTHGTIRVFDQAPTVGSHDIAYMLARDSLLPWRTALGNAAYGMEIRGVPTDLREQRAHELLRSVGLGDFWAKYPSALSQGMRQRCALARTFALDAKLLLMDEPFGALDAQTKLQLEDLLMTLWSGSRRTVVFVTHDLGEAVALSDRVVVLSRRPGRIIADIRIALDRPRSVRDLQRDDRFHKIYSELWTYLEAGMKGEDESAW